MVQIMTTDSIRLKERAEHLKDADIIEAKKILSKCLQISSYHYFL